MADGLETWVRGSLMVTVGFIDNPSLHDLS